MTETSADWVERPRPASVAARTTEPVAPPTIGRRERAAEQGSTTPDVRVVGAVAALVALVVALLLRQRRRR